jgi:hypothetical protein
MRINRKAVWTGLVLFVAAGVGCHKKQAYLDRGPENRTIFIHVRSNVQGLAQGKCYVDVETVYVYKPNHQKLKWKSDDGNKYTADFEMGNGYPNPKPGTPFKDAQGNDKHTVGTDEPEIEVTGPSGYYYYAVLDQNRKACLNPEDPGVHVTP